MPSQGVGTRIVRKPGRGIIPPTCARTKADKSPTGGHGPDRCEVTLVTLCSNSGDIGSLSFREAQQPHLLLLTDGSTLSKTPKPREDDKVKSLPRMCADF